MSERNGQTNADSGRIFSVLRLDGRLLYPPFKSHLSSCRSRRLHEGLHVGEDFIGARFGFGRFPIA